MYGKHAKKHRTEQAAFVKLIGGRAKGNRMQQLWEDSPAQGYGSHCGKEEGFRQKAIEEGFTGEQVNRFLDLS
jgi:hypothetical protein